MLQNVACNRDYNRICELVSEGRRFVFAEVIIWCRRCNDADLDQVVARFMSFRQQLTS